MENDLKTDKKECPKYGSKDVTFLGTGGGTRFVKEGQYFKYIGMDIWEYQIRGYQICSKWLTDRKSRQLSLDDIKHYCNTVTALKKTIEIQQQIDKIYPDVEKETNDYIKSSD